VVRPLPSSRDASARLSRTPRRDTGPELALRRELHRRGLRFFVGRPPLASEKRRRADIVFPRARVAVFVDGCFWHGCPQHMTWPKANAGWWRAKIMANVARDRRTDERLREAGWTVVRVWEHEAVDAAADRVERVVRETPSRVSRGTRPALR
jgi:DNA mismatch endonuclease (patch repair protein)